MTADELRLVLETELAWRQEELAFFKNQLNEIVEEDKDRYRKSLVLILYSHMEGYIKICLQTYIQYINSQGLKRKEVDTGLMVASMHKEFIAYENTERKSEFFRKELPDDTRLHRLYRRVDFMEKVEDFKEQELIIDDQIIDTESNLWYIVLQKNLYKVGLPINLFDDYQRDIDALVNRRNSIAHGNFKAGVKNTEFSNWEFKVSEMLSGVTRLLYDCLNIISNAIKYTNTGGTISCNVLQESCEKEDWCNMIITITDNGIGMSEEFQKRIFETFERERNTTSSRIEGSGIGMGITKKLVELMDGTIEVKSKQGEGSTFTVTIPCRKSSKEDSLVKRNSNLSNKNCLNGVRILLVEDNEINTEIATELLTEEGCIVETADDGVACVDMIEKADADYYKMILMDIQMPVMNGYDAALVIRKMKDTKKARIPIIAMTANAFAEDTQKALSVGMNAHVAKPVDMNILVPTMMKYL